MQKKDKEKEFIKVNIAVLTVSDSRTTETDKSGDYLFNSIQKEGHVCIKRSLIKDDVKSILDIEKSSKNNSTISFSKIPPFEITIDLWPFSISAFEKSLVPLSTPPIFNSGNS